MMKRLIGLTLALLFSAAIAVQAGTLQLKNGRQYHGTYLGGTADEIQFQINGHVRVFKTADVASIQFDASDTPTAGEPAAPQAPEAAEAPAAPVPQPQPQPQMDQAPSQAAYQGLTQTVTVPQGTQLMIRMIDSVDSSVNKPGDIFHASLEDDLRIGDVLVARRGADVYGKLTQVQSAGRATGKSELALELTGVRTVNGALQPIVSGEYQEAGKSRTGQTVKHGLGGAALGAIIGAVAGGGAGAAKGAVIGGAAGTGVTLITKGQQVKVPSETLLQFQLAQPFMITLPKSS